MNPETQLTHLGRPQSGPVNTPVYRASTIVFDSLAEFVDAREHPRHALTYGRYGTPTTFELENLVATLEGAAAAALAPSGLAAVSTSLQAFLRPGDHLLMPHSVYGPARRFALGLAEWGVETSFYPPDCGADIAGHLRANTRVVYLESPGSLTFDMQDIPAIAGVCRKRGIVTIADNTWATPLYFQPLRHGVDVSINAATKYIVGHSDAMLGTIAATQAAWPAIERTVNLLGVCVGPDDAFLASRGLRTLAVRLEKHARNALDVARWLQDRPEVAQVCYPPLPEDPGNAIWKRDFQGASGLMGVSLRPQVGPENFARLVDALRIFRLGGSWGGYESLIFPIDTQALHGSAPESEGPYFRLHIGLEHAADMIDDLRGAFDAAGLGQSLHLSGSNHE
ncbi:cystathionine beta-lyase [Variovorax sp. M-6]|uniref:cystathionine beta-lyase n=1 Tax=Variovorax sp. M-6 TaxID=3233041 RepID=UPI003F9B6394